VSDPSLIQGRAMVVERGPVVLVTTVGAVSGAAAAAATLARAASEPESAALLIDLGGGRAPRSSLIATAGARKLEERLVAHMPDAAVASRGSVCQVRLPADAGGIDGIATALPLVRESAGIVHLPPQLLRSVLEESRIRPTAVLLRADLAKDRALTALAARDLMARDLRVAVLKRPLGWVAKRVAMLGALPAGGEALSPRLCERLLTTEDKKLQHCYDERNGAESDQGEVSPQERHGPPRSQWGQEAERRYKRPGRT
jgi:hypothetical protein